MLRQALQFEAKTQRQCLCFCEPVLHEKLLLKTRAWRKHISHHPPYGELSCKVLFKTRDPKALTLRELAEHRLRFALRRLKNLVPRAQVQFSDVNGPRGGIDKHCQVELKTDTAGTLVVSAIAADWRSALDEALARAIRFLTHQVHRRQDTRRLRQRMVALES